MISKRDTNSLLRDGSRRSQWRRFEFITPAYVLFGSYCIPEEEDDEGESFCSSSGRGFLVLHPPFSFFITLAQPSRGQLASTKEHHLLVSLVQHGSPSFSCNNNVHPLKESLVSIPPVLTGMVPSYHDTIPITQHTCCKSNTRAAENQGCAVPPPKNNPLF